jgi:hypothetical protein
MRTLLLASILLLASASSGCLNTPIDESGLTTQETEPSIDEGNNTTVQQEPNIDPEPEPDSDPETEPESEENTDWSKECLASHSNLEMHIHPTLVIQIENDSYIVGANTGIDTEICVESMHIIHTHDDSGKLHVETPEVTDIKLSIFFEIWQVPFNENRILDYQVNSTHELIMKIDGEVSTEWGDHIFVDGESILIHYQKRD